METIETLNQRLIDHYGVASDTGQPLFRIVWADDQLEKRRVQSTDSGIELLFPQVLEVKKYSYLKNVFVLERLVAVTEPELLTNLSYEPLWVYRDSNNNPLPPIWDATKVVVDVLYAALGKKSLAKYVEDVSPEAKEERISKIAEELFGNETETGDALAYGEAIVVPERKE
jgi:hypothetical protein